MISCPLFWRTFSVQSPGSRLVPERAVTSLQFAENMTLVAAQATTGDQRAGDLSLCAGARRRRQRRDPAGSEQRPADVAGIAGLGRLCQLSHRPADDDRRAVRARRTSAVM